MKLYPKKLNNIRDLEQEKKRVRAALSRLDSEEFLPLKSLFDPKKKKNNVEESGFNIGTLLNFIPVSNPLVAAVVKLVQRKLTKNNVTGKQGPVVANVTISQPPGIMQKAKNFAKGAVLDVVTGYLKWKVIELCYKGIKYYIKTRKEKPDVQ